MDEIRDSGGPRPRRIDLGFASILGVTVATAPIAAAWLWLALVIRTDRLLRDRSLTTEETQ